MSSASNKIIQAAAGNAAGEGLYVEEVFSTYLYTGNRTARDIVNGIDLAGEGGMVWTSARNVADNKRIWDSERGVNKDISTNSTASQSTRTGALTAFNADGFSLGTDGAGVVNADSGETYASWTFRKAPKFFDVVTYTGDGTAGRTVSHNLGSVPGCIFVKRTDGAGMWRVFHRSLGATKNLYLNDTSAALTQSDIWNDTAPTDAVFTVGDSGNVNGSGFTYVAYLFAHNDGDGEFGEDADQDIIKCGSYTGNGSTDGPEIDLGFEPQFVIIKRSSATEDWLMFDSMRGMVVGGIDPDLRPSQSQAEGSFLNYLEPQPTGFKLIDPNTRSNDNGSTYIYIAIRRGPMKTPESGTEVFAPVARAGTGVEANIQSGFVVDAMFNKSRNVIGPGNAYSFDRLRGKNILLDMSGTGSEVSDTTSVIGFDVMDGVVVGTGATAGRVNYVYGSTFVDYYFRRAPGFFDVVAYEGDATTPRTINHNLSVAPELIIVKQRNTARSWTVRATSLGDSQRGYLNLTNAFAASASAFPVATYTSSTYVIGSDASVNASGGDYIAYLFATLPGISKVGSYTGNGSSQTIDCGFTTGARFVLIKPTSRSGDWVVLDTERGIVAGNDAILKLNSTDAEISADVIDPESSGFIINDVGTGFNNPSDTYIFLAIA